MNVRPQQLGEIFEDNSTDMCVREFPLMSMGGCKEGLVCPEPVARTHICGSGSYVGGVGGLEKVIEDDTGGGGLARKEQRWF